LNSKNNRGMMFESNPQLEDLFSRMFVAFINELLGTSYDWDRMTEKEKQKVRMFQTNFKWPKEQQVE